MSGAKMKVRSRKQKTKCSKKYEEAKTMKTAENVKPRRSSRLTANANRITKGRLTIPTGFFAGGVKSAVARKQPHKATREVLRRSSRQILDEDLHGLLRSAENNGQEAKNIGIFDDFGEDFDEVTARPVGAKEGTTSHEGVAGYYLDLVGPGRTCKGEKRLKKSQQGEAEAAVVTRRCYRGPRQPPKQKASTTLSPPTVQFDDINAGFTVDLLAQIKLSNLRSAKTYCLEKITQTVCRINLSLVEGISYSEDMNGSTQKRKLYSNPNEDKENCEQQVNLPALIPPSKWVFSTPDKHVMRKFFFDDSQSSQMVPAILQTSKKSSVLYDIKNEYMQYVEYNRYRYKHGDNVPIDARYLKTICENQREPTVLTVSPQPSKKIRLEDTPKDGLFNFRNMSLGGDDFVDGKNNELNMFLAGDAEKTVDIQNEIQNNIFIDENMDISFNFNSQAGPSKSEMDFNFDNCSFVFPERTDQNAQKMVAREAHCPVDYNHQLLMATRRPSKIVKTHPKRYSLKAKSLSFESSPEKMMPEPEPTKSGSDFEDSFSFISQKALLFQNPSSLPVDQPNCENPDPSANEDHQTFSYIPTFKLHPRVNYNHQ